MGDVTINDAIEKVRSERLKERNEGLLDLKHILTPRHRGDRLDALNDKGYHKIYEALFRVASAEKSSYGKATKANVKSQAAARLASCASVLRLAVEAGVRKLKQRSVKALIDHFTQTLPLPSGAFCEPLSLDYTKALRVILEFQPHVEHFGTAEWNLLVNFCCEGIKTHQGASGDPASSFSTDLSVRLASNGTPSKNSGATGLSGSSQDPGLQSKSIAEELVLSLEQLLLPDKMPSIDSAQSIFATFVQFLQLTAAVGRAHHAAFSAFNRCLSRTRTDYISLTQEAITQALPLIRRLWATKSASLRDEMLVTLIHAQDYLEKMVRDDRDLDVPAELERLLDVVQMEYSKRLDREQLQLEDVALSVSRPLPTRHHPLRLRPMYLRGSASRSEQGWLVLQLVGVITSLLDSRAVALTRPDASKKRRMDTRFGNLLRQLRLSDSSGRLYALQIIPFILDQRLLDLEEFTTLMDTLGPCLSDEDSTVASWAMIAMTSCAFQATSRSAHFSMEWSRIWHVASRSSTTASTCRASCHLLELTIKLGLVGYGSIADVVDSMISSIDLNGPALLTDSALSFLTVLLELRRSENPGLVSMTTERLIHWLISRWSPGTAIPSIRGAEADREQAKLTDRYAAFQYAQQANPGLVFDLLAACMGWLRHEIPSEIVPAYGTLAQAWVSHIQNQELIRYLLLLGDPSPSSGWNELGEWAKLDDQQETGVSHRQNEYIILEFCTSEFDRALGSWNAQVSERVQYINSDMVRALTSFCIIGSLLVSGHSRRDSHHVSEVSRSTEAMLNVLSSFVARSECDQVSVDAVLEVISSFMPDLSKPEDISKAVAWSGLKHMVNKLSSALEIRRMAERDHIGQVDLDDMDIDDGFESQRSLLKREAADADFPRHYGTARASVATFRHTVSASLHLLSNLGKTPIDASSSTAFVDYLISLKPHELLVCGGLITEATKSVLPFDRSEADRILVHLGQQCLQAYEYDRCEVSMGLCLSAMTGLASLWSQDLNDDLSETGTSLYQWFIDVALEKGIASSKVQMDIANLLQRLLQVEPDYAKGISTLSSVRTSLLKVLQDGDMSVKFHVTERIEDIFALFVLKRHDAIFEDVLSSLPRDADWKAGIALRMLVLARLASSWYTLLRRCVYHIFETPGLIPDAAGHAARCLSEVSKRLKLRDSRELLGLFLPQILYTWLETQPLQLIPFSIFGYDSLLELLRDIRHEATSQLVMRGHDDQVASLAASLSVRFEDLIIQSFDKAMAYSVARDISLPPAEGSTHHVGGEVRIRKRLGKDAFLLQVQLRFAQTVALFFRCVEQEDQVERAFQKRPHFEYAAEIWMQIKGFSCSESALPVNQQPSFRARYLLDEIHHLCHRTKHDATQIWKPSLLTFILRTLLDSIHPALGSLHACSVIRRVRILVSIAGDSILRDYPLEMLLHSLRPFLTDPQCAEDTIGLMQYLLQAGREYLTHVPSFVAGTSLSILASLRAFLELAQDSTNLESQHRATLSKARAFHGWFSTWLGSYNSPYISGETETAFRSIIRAACNIRVQGGATIGTYESDILRELLEDARSGRNLLNRPSQNLAFSLLCVDFQGPATFRDDIFGRDEAAITNAVAVWRSCQRPGVGKSYLSWVGRILGRAYASTGHVPKDMLPQSRLDHTIRSSSGEPSGHWPSSKTSILKFLHDLLLGDSRVDVSLAERTLQLVFLRLSDPEEVTTCEQILPHSLLVSLEWQNVQPPELNLSYPRKHSVGEASRYREGVAKETWIRDLCISLSYAASDDPIVGALTPILSDLAGFAEQLFPYILHVVLLREVDGQQLVRSELSIAFRDWFRAQGKSSSATIKILLTALLHLRRQPMPRETTKADRERWLDIDYGEAAEAAARCRMFKTALLLIEIQSSQAALTSRRSSSVKAKEPVELLTSIFRNIEDPDSFYGVQQQASLSSIMDRLEFERDGFKSLSFRGAHYDSRLRRLESQSQIDPSGLISALGCLELNGLSFSLLRDQRLLHSEVETSREMYQSARKLEQWDLPTSMAHKGEEATLYRAFQFFNSTVDRRAFRLSLETGILDIMGQLMSSGQTETALRASLRSLGVLTEMDEVLSSENAVQLQESWERMKSRESWMQTGRFEDVNQFLSARETIFSSLSRRPHLQELIKTSPRDIRQIEVSSLLRSSFMSRRHGALQSSLMAATYLTELIGPCRDVGMNIEAAAQNEVADVLWDQGEMTASIRVLQDVNGALDIRNQAVRVGKSELLAKLGHQVSEARLEKPDEIISRYLLPAIKELKGLSEGNEAGQVFHEFAAFCDQQLQDPDNLEDYQRAQRLRERKGDEVRDLEKMYKAAASQNKGNLQIYRNRAKQWFELDDREYQRLHESRQAFLRQSLENYLRCLRACETYNNDALRFCALWLEQSNPGLANKAVSKHLLQVPSRKFASLINQLSSRLLDTKDDFQALLFPLILKICVDHPYHGMYQIFSTSKSRGKDEMAVSRHAAASRMVSLLSKDENSATHWLSIHNTSVCYAKLAGEKLDEKSKAGSRVPLRKLKAGQRLEHDVVACKIPPPTMKVELQADGDYSKVPVIVRFHPEFSVAGGVSAPKIVTAVASDGVRYKQLVKGGNDDLRQDAIMEQVFERVSQLLQNDRSTRQRNLGIRTYKVLPLTTNAGIIEFVPDTLPLHEFLMPAHQKHFPKDWKPHACRKVIGDVQSKPVDVRLKAYRQVADHFHPVMRFFFMERFDSPDDWFEKRLAYIRSTAAISILGHVLGLGDRHGHNILLDEGTGEVVHIDLGVAFEQGRVLPVPEVVPFRLTRDIVDGMGITKTEGAFRRCCEFTLDALRKESYSIMTILDVLRYDPLYSWTVSPLRVKRQLEQDEDPGPSTKEAEAALGTRKKEANEPSEADRALTVVAKKLSKTLSVTATVNELIQQATDERNLAMLYCGWAAYA